MEESTLLWIGGAGILGVLAYKYLGVSTPAVVAPMTSNIMSSGVAPPVASVATQTAQQSTVATGTQQTAVVPAVAQVPTVPQFTAGMPAGTVTTQGVYSGTPGVFWPVGSNYTAAEKQRMIDDLTGKLAAGLPNIIPPSQAADLLQVPASVIDNMKMGSGVGTSYGSWSLQPAGFVPLDKVNVVMEQQLVAKYGGMTYSQYRVAVGLSGLGNFIRSTY